MTTGAAEQLQFSIVERRRVVAAFDGGRVSSDAGALLLGKADAAIVLLDRLAGASWIGVSPTRSNTRSGR